MRGEAQPCQGAMGFTGMCLTVFSKQILGKNDSEISIVNKLFVYNVDVHVTCTQCVQYQ